MPSVNRSSPTRLIRKFNFPVPAGSTVDYNYISVSKFKFTKFFVEILETVTGEASVFTENIANTSGDIPEDVIFGKVGDKLKYSFNVLKIGSDIVIRVDNQEDNPITVTIIRITI